MLYYVRGLTPAHGGILFFTQVGPFFEPAGLLQYLSKFKGGVYSVFLLWVFSVVSLDAILPETTGAGFAASAAFITA